jgi:hypothetical protein
VTGRLSSLLLEKTKVPAAATGVEVGVGVGEGVGVGCVPGVDVAGGAGVGVGMVAAEVVLTLPHPIMEMVTNRPRISRLKAETKFFILALHQGKVGCCWIRNQSRAAGWLC